MSLSAGKQLPYPVESLTSETLLRLPSPTSFEYERKKSVIAMFCVLRIDKHDTLQNCDLNHKACLTKEHKILIDDVVAIRCVRNWGCMKKSLLSLAKRFKRYDAGMTGITGRITDREDAVLRNISVGGASFYVDKPFKVRSACNVDIEIDGKTINVRGRIVWSRKAGKESTEDEARKSPYTIGVMFNNSNYNETGLLLTELLENLEPPIERRGVPSRDS